MQSSLEDTHEVSSMDFVQTVVRSVAVCTRTWQQQPQVTYS
jgi:hypothetical protein